MGDVELEAAADFSVGFAFGSASFDLCLGCRVVALTLDGDDVERSVEVSVSPAVESVAVGVSTRCGADE